MKNWLSARHHARPADTLCSAFLEQLPVSGASISVFGANGRQAAICNSGSLAARAESLQFELGEGPHWEALASRSPVICAELSLTTPTEWPMFARSARELGILGVFSFPMKLGTAMVGVVDLYAVDVVTVDDEFMRTADSLAHRAAAPAIELALASADDHSSTETSSSPLIRREVHQAVGILIAQLQLSASEASALLRARSFSSNIPLGELANAIIERRISFDDDPSPAARAH